MFDQSYARRVLNAFVGVCALCGLLTSSAYAAQPNVLFIYLDDFGWKDTGYMGSDFFETPNLDRLAAEGMIFTDAYSCAANCAPARACLLSGQYTPRHQIFNVGTGPRGNAKFRRLLHVPGVNTLDPKIRTWAQCVQEAGYVTASMGKWHLSRNPVPYGFDINIGGTHSGSPPKGYYPPHVYSGSAVPGLEQAPEHEYLTDRLSDEAITFIRDNKAKPWFLYLTHFAVHTPLNAKQELVPKFKAKQPGELHDSIAMATMIQSVDDGVGKIVRTLDEMRLTANTIVIFYSDNGGYGGATDMAPLRASKGSYYEGGIRVPFFVKWPGAIEPGTTSAEPITGVDLYPTLCEMTGAKLPPNQPLDGVSIVPLLKAPQSPGPLPNDSARSLGGRALFWHFPAYLQANARDGREARDPLFRTRPCSIIRLGDWKLHHYFEDNGLELYNLKEDIGETNDLSASMPEKAKELLIRLDAWRERIGAPIPADANPQFDARAEAAAVKAAQQKTPARPRRNQRRREGRIRRNG